MHNLNQPYNKKHISIFKFLNNRKKINKNLYIFTTKQLEKNADYDYIYKHSSKSIHDNLQLNKLTCDDIYYFYISYVKNRVKESSLYDIKKIYDKHIKLYFGTKLITKITKRDIFYWQIELDNQGYSYKYKTKIRCYISCIFDYAVKYFDLPNNVVKQVDNFKNNRIKQEIQVWSYDEYKKFISMVDDNIYRLLFSTLYFTGCRKGEALALTWKDIDFENRTLTINKSLTRKCEYSTYTISTPKNNSSIRKLLIPSSLNDSLLHLKEQETNQDKLIFSDMKGYPLAENTISRKFKYYTHLAGVKDIRIHDLRHSHASLLISLGESIVLVAKRLGHANIEQTLNTYSHIMPNEEQRLIDKLNKL